MSSTPTIKIVNYFSVAAVKDEPLEFDETNEQKWLPQVIPNFSDCDENLLVIVCLNVEMLVSSEVKLELHADRNLMDTDTTESLSPAKISDDECGEGMSQALDSQLRISRTNAGSKEEKSDDIGDTGDSDSEAEYRYVLVRSHWRRVRVPRRSEARNK